MNSISDAQKAQSARIWAELARSLNIKVLSPFVLMHRAGSIDCVAFLPHFGGRQGMVIGLASPPDFSINKELVGYAKAEGLFYSFINPEIYTDYDENGFKDMLRDWGYFGPENERPLWLKSK